MAILWCSYSSPLTRLSLLSTVNVTKQSVITLYLLTHSLTLTMSHLCIHRMKPLVLATRTWRPLSTAVAAKPKRRTLESRERPAPITVVSHSHTHSLTHTFTPSLTPVLTHSLTHAFTHAYTLSLSLTHSLTYTPIYTYSLSLPRIYLHTHPLNHSLTHSYSH